MPDTNQVQRILNDENFYALPPGERVKVLSQLDSNFAALPAEEQNKVISRGVQQSLASTNHPLAGASQATSMRANNQGWSDRIMSWVNQKLNDLRPGTDLAGINDPTIQNRQRLAAGIMAGPVTGIPEFAAGAARVMGSKSPDDQRPYYRRALQGGTEEISGLANSLGPVGLVTTPNAVPAVASFGLGSAALGKATDRLPVSQESKDFINTAAPAAVGLRNLVRGDVAPPRARDVLHPTPDVPPGLSPEATANLTDKTARLGTQDIFRAASPSSDNPGFRERLATAAPDLAEIQRRTPLQTSGGLLNPDYRIREFTTNANNYLDDLWNNQRQPQIDRNANAVRSLDPVKQSIVDSVSDLDRENYPGAVQEIARKVQSMPDYETLGQLSDRLREVNAQRTAFRGMTPQEQAAANITAPKIDAINAEYRALQDAISDELANRGEQGIQDFDKRYGAISEVRDALQSQMNPAEATRLLDQVKAWISPGGAAGIHQRLPIVASPGRTLESGLNRLARSPLTPPATAAPNPPPIAGLLPPPPPILAPPADRSGPVGAADRIAPMTWTPDMINRVARQTPAPPPPVMPSFRSESTQAPNPNAIGPTGRGGIQINTLPTEHHGEGNYAGLLPGPPPPFVPPPPAPPMPLVGTLPPLGFPAETPSLWEPRGPFSPTWQTPGASVRSLPPETTTQLSSIWGPGASLQPTAVELPEQSATMPVGTNPRLQLLPPLFPPKR